MIDIKISFTTLPLEDENDREYVTILHQLLAIMFMQVSSHDFEHIHPIYKKAVNVALGEAGRYVNKTKSNLERRVMQNVLDWIKGSKFQRYKNFISADDVIKSIKLHPKYRERDDQTISENFIVPFIKTMTGKQYIGPASFPYMSFYADKIWFLPERQTKHFDNTDFVTDPVRMRASYSYYWGYIGSFDFSGRTFDHLISTLSHTRVPCFEYRGPLTFPEICSRILTQSNQRFKSKWPELLQDQIRCLDLRYVQEWLKSYVDYSSDLKLEDSIYLPLIAKYLNLSELTVNYFMKKTNVTVEERDSVSGSFLSNYTKSNNNIGMEAADDEFAEDEEDEIPEEGGEPEEDDPVTDDDVEDDEDTEDDPEEGDPEEDETEEDDIDADTTSDESDLFIPKLIELEIAEDEDMGDALYKERICQLVESYNEEPPADLSPEELLLLTHWCAQWIFLVSAKTTKRLLSELAITIDVNDDN